MTNNIVNEEGSNQKLISFIRGNAISGAPTINGTNQFPISPVIIGITLKSAIARAWGVRITVESWSAPVGVQRGWPSALHGALGELERASGGESG